MKNSEEILKQKYLSANDIMVIIPICKSGALRIITEAQADMKSKGYYIPETKTKLALTKIVIKKLGL